MQFKPLTEMDTGELAAELESLIDVLPSLRHMPTITLDKAVALVDKTRQGADEEQRKWLLQLIQYSTGHAARFAAVVQRIADLRAYLVPDEIGVDPVSDRQVHPVLTERQLFALLSAHRAFRGACDTFVHGVDQRNALSGTFEEQQLVRFDAEAVRAGNELAKRFAPSA